MRWPISPMPNAFSPNFCKVSPMHNRVFRSRSWKLLLSRNSHKSNTSCTALACLGSARIALTRPLFAGEKSSLSPLWPACWKRVVITSRWLTRLKNCWPLAIISNPPLISLSRLAALPPARSRRTIWCWWRASPRVTKKVSWWCWAVMALITPPRCWPPACAPTAARSGPTLTAFIPVTRVRSRMRVCWSRCPIRKRWSCPTSALKFCTRVLSPLSPSSRSPV